MSNNEPLVSVIIPLYNAEKYILETIASVINQTYINWELIVVDDCSTDNSMEIVQNIAIGHTRIQLIKSINNFGGPARPRNIGIKHAKGKYIAFLDADDVWLPMKLQNQLSIMQDKNLNFSSTSKQTIDQNSINIDSKRAIRNYVYKFSAKRKISTLIIRNFIHTSSVVLKKELLSDFDESKEMIAVEDYCQWLNILSDSKIKYMYIDEPLLKYRELEGSISHSAVKHSHATKANLCILQFILLNNQFDLLNYFYIRIIRNIVINSAKGMLGK